MYVIPCYVNVPLIAPRCALPPRHEESSLISDLFQLYTPILNTLALYTWTMHEETFAALVAANAGNTESGKLGASSLSLVSSFRISSTNSSPLSGSLARPRRRRRGNVTASTAARRNHPRPLRRSTRGLQRRFTRYSMRSSYSHCVYQRFSIFIFYISIFYHRAVNILRARRSMSVNKINSFIVFNIFIFRLDDFTRNAFFI